MARNGKVAALGSVGLFSGCSDRELRTIAQLCTEFRFDEGFVLTTEGSPGQECFVIAEGTAEVVIDGHTVAKVGPGECVGEMSLLDGGPRTATVVTMTPMTAYVLSTTEFRSLLGTSPTIDRKIMAGLARRLRGAETDRPH
jgi:CRP-like cAMP-binding protein